MTKQILVVEDDFANQRVASLFLQKLGHEVDIAENGQEALSRISEKQYDLILMDCQMPVMDGFAAAKKIRESFPDYAQTPIVALTANVVAGIRDECQQAGMNDVLNKPVHLSNMQDMLDKWVK